MARKQKIFFRCWYCNRKLAADWERVGERRVCNCGRRYRVPSRNGLAKRDKTLIDWILEFVIYGIGGGFFGLIFGMIFFRFAARSLNGSSRLLLIAVPTLIGFFAGAVFGEAGVNWIGSLLRKTTEEDFR